MRACGRISRPEASNQIVRSREVSERLMNSGAEPAGGTPEEWTAFLRNEIAKWTKIAKTAGMKAE